MTAPALVPGEFVKVSVTQTVASFFGGDHTTYTFWFFARYISTVDHQIVIEHADGHRQLVDTIRVHPLDVTVPNQATS